MAVQRFGFDESVIKRLEIGFGRKLLMLELTRVIISRYLFVIVRVRY